MSKWITCKNQKEANAAIANGDFVVIRGNAIIRVRGNATVRVRDYATVKACGYATVEAWDYANVEACGYATVKACDYATVEAWDNATVRVRDYATVEAWGNAAVEAWDYASVKACGNAVVKAEDNATVKAWDNASVKAFGNAVVKAYDNAAVEVYDYAAVEAWGHAVAISRVSTTTLTGNVCFLRHPIKLADWLKQYNLTPKNEAVILYTASGKSLYGTEYTIGQTITAPDWDSDPARKCGGGLHVCPQPWMCDQFIDGEKKYFAVQVELSDISTCYTPRPQYPDEVRVRKCTILYEVDRDGNQI